MERKWKKRLELGWFDGPCISWNTYLTYHPDFELSRPMLVAQRSFVIRYKNWCIEEFHTWYDGPNCSWSFGPFMFSQNGQGYCKKCESDTWVNKNE
jgi:hypothetical protein